MKLPELPPADAQRNRIANVISTIRRKITYTMIAQIEEN
jgi:hypothetical protein